MPCETLADRLNRFDFTAGYLAGCGSAAGRACRDDMSRDHWARGYLAGRIALWCGVDLSTNR